MNAAASYSLAPALLTPAEDFSAALLAWHDVHGRHDLPWRRSRTPYRVWIAEIMLQQTQVITVIPYFQRFLDALPDLAALAAARLDTVLQLWAGLGYYSRARNLHAAAQRCVAQHGGGLPVDHDALTRLPGIGRSTAGAILALAHDRSEPILDGNVKRVLSRYHGLTGTSTGTSTGTAASLRELWTLAAQHTPQRRAGAYTQAIMDLGATVCTPHRPACPRCPVRIGCAMQFTNMPGSVTAVHKAAKPPRRRIPSRRLRMLILRNPAGAILLQRRPATGIWGGLWSLPELAPETELQTWGRERLGQPLTELRSGPRLRHVLTHVVLDIESLHARLAGSPQILRDGGDYCWLDPAAIETAAVPAAVRKIIRIQACIEPSENAS